jgi:HD superfamily phosphohydrolase
MKLNKRIRTVLYDDQRFSSAELELLHTPAFQRLYDLHQLGLTDRIFIDASHSRLHHVVGVVEQATNLMTSLARNLRSKPDVRLDYTGGPHKLQRYKNGVQLMPQEHPEHNSAKAKDIKRDLERFLS